MRTSLKGYVQNMLSSEDEKSKPVEFDGVKERQVKTELPVEFYEVANELALAKSMHAAMATEHHGYAIIKEELDELWEEIRKKQPDKRRMREEAIQVAAMAIRFMMDICNKEDS